MGYVTLSNRDITNGLELVTEFKKRRLPVPLSYAMAVTIRRFKTIVQTMFKERLNIISEHALRDSDGKQLDEVKDQVAFNADIDSLLEQTNEVDVHQITLDRLQSLKGHDGKAIELSIDEQEGLILLSMIIDDGEEPSEEPN